MKPDVSKILEVAEKIKTPLVLSGTIVIILYLIFHQILALNIFANIGSSNTVLVLQNIIVKIFWLAVLSVVLGVGSYVLLLLLKHQSGALLPKVELIDARLDHSNSVYEEVEEKGKKTIRPKEEVRKEKRQ